MGNNNGDFPVWFRALLIVGGIAILILIVLLPFSFSYLDFYDYGFRRRHTTGRVDLGRVYDGGRYLIGPDY